MDESTKTVYTEYNRGEMFCDPAEALEVYREGDELINMISKISDSGVPERSITTVRAFLHQHSQVVGSELIFRLRLDLFKEVKDLSPQELVERLYKLLDISRRFTDGIIAADTMIATAFANATTSNES